MSNLPIDAKYISFHSGYRVAIKSELYPAFAGMQLLSRDTSNYWAGLFVKELKSLSSGQFKKHVFVQNIGHGEYTMILPGGSASFRQYNTSDFYIYDLKPDSHYYALQQSKKKPGLFNVEKVNNNWEAKIVPSGLIEKKGVNIVAISDKYMEVEDALEDAPDAIGNSGHASGRLVKENGFGLHFTPGEKHIGGLTNIQQANNADTDPSLHESAILLARTMENARSIKGVAWISAGGGSGVLTQAMRILKDRGVDFKESEHFAFFSNLTTNLTKAEQLARNIGMSFDRKSHSKNLLNIEQLFGRGFLSGFAAGWQRYRNDQKYTALKFGVDAYKEFSEHKAIVGMFGVTGTAVAAALGCSTVAASLPAGIAFAVATQVGPKVLGIGGATMKAYFPKQYKKLTDHF